MKVRNPQISLICADWFFRNLSNLRQRRIVFVVRGIPKERGGDPASTYSSGRQSAQAHCGRNPSSDYPCADVVNLEGEENRYQDFLGAMYAAKRRRFRGGI